MEAGSLLRALNPFKIRAKFSGSFTVRCSSSSYSTKIPTGKEMGKRAYDGLLLDAANTLLQLTKPVEETYAAIGKKYGWSLPSFNGNSLPKQQRRNLFIPFPIHFLG